MVHRIVSLLFALLFAVAAGVQLDDPDSQPWIAVYAAAAVATALFILKAQREGFRSGRRWFAWGVALVALFWAAQLVPPMLREGVALDHEVSREVGGLLLVSVVSTLLAATARKR